MLLNEEQRLMQDSVRQFVRDRIAPQAEQWAKDKAVPREVLTEMGQLGLLGMTTSPEWDGAGADYVSYALALMEVAAGDGGLSTIMSVNNAPMCAALSQQGSDAQKAEFLAPMARGEMIGAFCLTESHAGSDASAIRTRATREGDEYVIKGSKQFITSGRIGGCALIFAVTDPSIGKRGISAFIVHTDNPGFKVTKTEEKLGQASSDTCALSFDNMRVPASALLGEEGQGYRIALGNLETGRIGIASQSVGMARAALDYAINYAQERESMGLPIIEHQAVAFRLAEMQAKLEAARQLTLHAAALKDAGEPCLDQACMAKLVASETAEKVCSAAIQTLGGYGYLADFPVERIYRDVRVCQIYEGTSDIQKLIISRGLSR
ncbi:MAG: acyl-CoA dehydrogenase family protein [Granulosicoccaceae bacterium]